MSELVFLTLNIRLGAAQGLVGVADISLLTAADGLVVDHLTLGCRSTGPGTRVTALLSQTGEVAGTLTVENTLRSGGGLSNWEIFLCKTLTKLKWQLRAIKT